VCDVKVAISGGSGLVGRALTASFLGDGHEVVVLTRDAARAATRLPRGAIAVDWAPTDPASLATNLDGVDAVIHLAGARVGPRPWTRRRRAVITASRVDGARVIVDAIERLPAERRPRTFAVVSGIDAYPVSDDGPDPAPMTEATPTGLGFLADVTRALESEALRAKPLGTRVVRLRMGHVLGRGAMLVRILALPVRLFVGGRLGTGRQWVSWIHIDDVVGLFRLAVEDPDAPAIINLVAPGAVTQIDFVRSIARVLHRPVWFPAPGWAIRLFLRDEASLILDSRRVAPVGAVAAGYAFRYPAIDAAFEDVLG
jgi:uncharacterized protein